MPDDIAVSAVTFKKNGDLFQEVDGSPVKIAHYDKAKQDLELESQEIASNMKLVNKITAAIGTINKGTSASGLTIKTMGVKGETRDAPKGKVPVKPKRDLNFGDQTPAIVEWYFKHYPKEAIIRYGVFTDENGEMVRRDVKRRVSELIDDRDGDHGFADEARLVGPKKWEKGPVGVVVTQEILQDQIIARRATHMTFAPQEVIGGFDSSDDNDGEQMADDGGEE